ncbi:hypothetical protein ACROYT_G015395 [Oculina patagonica]
MHVVDPLLWETSCPRTHAPRIARHDRIAIVVQDAATKAGWSCIREPAIPTRTSLHKPDLIFHHRDRDTFVLDMTIMVDNANLSEAHTRKTQYYDEPDISCWIQRNISGRVMHFSSVTLSWRGLMALASVLLVELGPIDVVEPEDWDEDKKATVTMGTLETFTQESIGLYQTILKRAANKVARRTKKKHKSTLLMKTTIFYLLNIQQRKQPKGLRTEGPIDVVEPEHRDEDEKATVTMNRLGTFIQLLDYTRL